MGKPASLVVCVWPREQPRILQGVLEVHLGPRCNFAELNRLIHVKDLEGARIPFAGFLFCSGLSFLSHGLLPASLCLALACACRCALELRHRLLAGRKKLIPVLGQSLHPLQGLLNVLGRVDLRKEIRSVELRERDQVLEVVARASSQDQVLIGGAR